MRASTVWLCLVGMGCVEEEAPAREVLSAGYLEDESAGSEAKAVLLTDMDGGCDAAAQFVTAWNEIDAQTQCDLLTALAEQEGPGPHRYTLLQLRPGAQIEGAYTLSDLPLEAGTFGGSTTEFVLSDPCDPVPAFADVEGVLTIDRFEDGVLAGQTDLGVGLSGTFEATACTFPFVF
jgi:hypothetical protein